MPGDDALVLNGEAIPLTREEVLTEQFYAWERRGRGWQLWEYPVALEPPFVPFYGHYAAPTPAFDDTRKQTAWSSLVERLRERIMGVSTASPSPVDLLVPELIPDVLPASYASSGLVELQVALRPDSKISRDATEQFLLALSLSESPLSFEIVGLPESITLQIVAGANDQSLVRRQLAILFPEARLRATPDFLISRWDRSDSNERVIVDFGLGQEFTRPLKVYERLDTDPLIAVAGAVSELEQSEIAVLQVLFRRAHHEWRASILRAVGDTEGGSFFTDAPEMPTLAREKLSRPLFAAVIRVAAESPNYGRAWEITRQLGGALEQFANPLSNELIPLTNDGYPDAEHEKDLLRRETHRSGMLLNSAELISLVHPSTAPLRIPRLRREETKTKRAPKITQGHRLVLGENVHQGERATVSLGLEQRIRHAYVIGASGTGKSSLFLNMVIQDVHNGEGVGVLDPHGDLVDQILGHIPEERTEDVVLLDPSDEAYPVGFNILSAHSELEKNLLGSDLVAVFRRLSTTWGDQMGSVLANAILAFLENERGGTLADLRRFLVESEFRDVFLSTVSDPEVVYYWQKEFPLLKGKPQAPILTRLDAFLRPKLIRYMVSQKENRLNFRAIMDGRKIFLAKLAQGAIGEANAYLLGALLVSKFHQLAMGRQDVAASDRPPFYLYIDEFQNFVTPSMASVLSGARKYHLGLVLAHQELRQLSSRDPEVASAVISNPATRICFRLGDADAKKLAAGFSFFEADDLQNLGVGEAICRVERAEYDFNLKTLPLPKPDPQTARARRERLIALSRERYGKKREEFEAEQYGDPAQMPGPHTRESRAEPQTRFAPAVSVAEPMRQAQRESVEAVAAEPPRAGRGGQQHRYLQELVKRWGASRGYRVTIEKQVLDGLGSVDVALEKENVSIACEISVTSTAEQELRNVKKCLAAGFSHVVVICPDRKSLPKTKEFILGGIYQPACDRVHFYAPEEFFAFAESLDTQIKRGDETVRGYKVKVRYKALGDEEKSARKHAISEVVLGALRRLKGGKQP